MRRQFSRAGDSWMAERRIDGSLLARRVVKNALSSVRGLYGRLRREGTRANEKIDGQNRVDETRGKLTPSRIQLDVDELWNLRNENLENELKELAMKIGQ